MNLELGIMQFIDHNLRSLLLDNLMIFFTKLGEFGLVWLLTGITLIFFRKYRKYGVMLMISSASAFIIGEFLIKNIVCRMRPCFMVSGIELILDAPNSFSFPSSHASTAFASSWILLKMNKKIGIASIVVAVLISFSRVYLFAHYPTDILGGALLGILCAQMVYMMRFKFSKNHTAPVIKNN